MPHKIVLLATLFLFSSFHTNNDAKYPPLASFPQPKGIRNMLFYIQRAKDHNTIVYQLNTDDKGDLITDNPIRVYWIKYTQEKKEEPLTMIQKKFAYGIKVQLIDAEKEVYQFHFVSYKEKYFYLRRSPKDHKFHVYGKINDTYAQINKVFVNIQGGTFWFPKIESVSIKGKGLKTSQPLIEKIIP